MAEPKKLVKRTFYFEQVNIAAMERERLRRIGAGEARIDSTLTRLLNEAIRDAYRPAKGGR
jgi:hypothetical protein